MAMKHRFAAEQYLRKNLRFWREERRLTIKELAQRIGVSPASVSDWERGVRSMTLERICEVADLLDVEVADMFGPTPAHHAGELPPLQRAEG